MSISLKIRKNDGSIIEKTSWVIPKWFRPIVGDFTEIVVISSINIEEINKYIKNGRGVYVFDEENGKSSITFTCQVEEIRYMVGKEIEFEAIAIVSCTGGQNAEELIEILYD